ncbi:MAG: metabolite traffic protein EboE [Planctomycetaceae bacterium]|nr:metabolite traffic protein EboE [Planctomycetaceae bacterium]
MSVSTLPLSYCTNVHPGRSLDEVCEGLLQYTAPTRREFGAPIAAGLWLAQPVIRELTEDRRTLSKLQDVLAEHDLACYTLNAFPFGDFHSSRVKEKVYLPDWTTAERPEYTHQCAQTLARLMPEGTEGSISTLPLGFKQLPREDDFTDRCIDNLIMVARLLDELHDDSGRVIRLAIEPEPLCLLETTDETLAFFEVLRQRAEAAGVLDAAIRHLGICYDVCHQSVEFEDVADSIQRLQAAEIRINKVHITCAIRLTDPGRNVEGREALAQYVEPRYLHQTFAKSNDGDLLAALDLSAPLALDPPPEYRDAAEWRVHFHVPVHAESLGPLSTTRSDLKRALTAVAGLEYAPHLEVETYTWEVLPGFRRPDLVRGLTEELTATRTLLADLNARPRPA